VVGFISWWAQFGCHTILSESMGIGLNAYSPMIEPAEITNKGSDNGIAPVRGVLSCFRQQDCSYPLLAAVA
jgi:hypothetical protein